MVSYIFMLIKCRHKNIVNISKVFSIFFSSIDMVLMTDNKKPVIYLCFDVT